MVRQRNIGDYKRIFERAKSYASSLNFLMIGYIFVEKTGWSWWFMLIVPVVIILSYLDATYVHPKEVQSAMNKNPDWTELCDSVKRIEKR